MSKVVLSTVSSDSHMWNLVYLDLFLSEHGHQVVNLGACTPIDLVIEATREDFVEAVVVSSVNGHGACESISLIQRLRASGWEGLALIGGKLTTSGDLAESQRRSLLEAGFDAVLEESDLPVLATLDLPRFPRVLEEVAA